MNEKNLLASARASLKKENVEMFSFSELSTAPELKELGQNRGLPFTFLEGETLTFESLKDAVFFTSTFKSGGNTYHILKTFAVSDKRGLVRVPAAALCRIPSLEEERDLLFAENEFGKKLADAEADWLRLVLCCEAGKVKVTKRLMLHQDRWVTNKETNERERVQDSPELLNRKSLVCFQFATV